MFVKAKMILASDLMYAKDVTEEGAAAWLDDVLSKPAAKQARKPKRPQPRPEDSASPRRGRSPRKPGARRAQGLCESGGVLDAAAAGRDVDISSAGGNVWAIWSPPVRRPSRRRPAESVRRARGRPLLADLARLHASDWIDVIVVAAPPDWEGARDPPRRGDRRVEGLFRCHRGDSRHRHRCMRRWPGCPRTRSSCRPRRPWPLVGDDIVERMLAPLGEDSTVLSRAFPCRTR